MSENINDDCKVLGFLLEHVKGLSPVATDLDDNIEG
jgi:hypothetical protein